MSHIQTEKYHPSSYSTASTADRLVRHMKSEDNLSLLAAVDKLITPENFAQFLIGPKGELPELAAELNRSHFQPEKFVGELNDVMVFVFSWYIAHGIHLDLSDIPYKRNLKGNKSNVLDELTHLSWEFLSDPRAGLEIAEITTSMMYYADIPGPKYRLYQNFDQTISKVLSNRPPEFYGTTDYFTGKQLTDEQVRTKYAFNEKILRKIRDSRLDPDKPLTEADVYPWREYLLAWNVSGMLEKFFADFASAQKTHDESKLKVLVWSANNKEQKAA